MKPRAYTNDQGKQQRGEARRNSESLVGRIGVVGLVVFRPEAAFLSPTVQVFGEPALFQFANVADAAARGSL